MIAILIINPLSTFAHSGGHYHHGDATVYNTWQLKNGNSLKGNFLMNKGDVIYLEKENGKLLGVPLEDLSIQDQKLANFKINKLNEINQNFDNSIPSNANSKILITILEYLLILLTPLFIFKLITPTLFGLIESNSAANAVSHLDQLLKNNEPTFLLSL